VPGVRIGFPVVDARQRVPTLKFFHSFRGKTHQALRWVVDHINPGAFDMELSTFAKEPHCQRQQARNQVGQNNVKIGKERCHGTR